VALESHAGDSYATLFKKLQFRQKFEGVLPFIEDTVVSKSQLCSYL